MDEIKYLDLDKLFPNRRCAYWEYSPICQNGKWGLEDEKHSIIIPCEYDKPLYWNRCENCVILQTIDEDNMLTSYIFNSDAKVLCSYKRRQENE